MKLPAVLFLSCCALTPLAFADDISEPAPWCAVEHQKSGWLKTLEQTEKRWGVSSEAQLALIAEEWGLAPEDLPPWWRPSWTFPDRRVPGIQPGYFDATWTRYKFETHRNSASWKSFEDVSDFIGWYIASTAPRAGVRPGDAAGVYILWRKGYKFYASGQWQTDPALIYRAEQFAISAEKIAHDLRDCPEPVAKEARERINPDNSEALRYLRPWTWRPKRDRAFTE